MFNVPRIIPSTSRLSRLQPFAHSPFSTDDDHSVPPPPSVSHSSRPPQTLERASPSSSLCPGQSLFIGWSTVSDELSVLPAQALETPSISTTSKTNRAGFFLHELTPTKQNEERNRPLYSFTSSTLCRYEIGSESAPLRSLPLPHSPKQSQSLIIPFYLNPG